jgi:hypothetical protein
MFPRSHTYNLQTLDHEATRPESNVSSPRPGAKKTYNYLDERNLLRHVRQNPQQTYAQLKKAAEVQYSHKVIRHILQGNGITNWLAAKRPMLTKKAVKARYEWCKARRHWTAENWGMIMWSDECSLERGSGKQRTWCFRTPDSK